MIEKEEGKSGSGVDQEGSTARTEAPASEPIARSRFDPNCEDCCDPVTPCLAHAAMPTITDQQAREHDNREDDVPQVQEDVLAAIDEAMVAAWLLGGGKDSSAFRDAQYTTALTNAYGRVAHYVERVRRALLDTSRRLQQKLELNAEDHTKELERLRGVIRNESRGVTFWRNEAHALRSENDRLKRFETYVCGVIAMGTQADLTVEALPR